jgi:hypothetical protein
MPILQNMNPSDRHDLTYQTILIQWMAKNIPKTTLRATGIFDFEEIKATL